VDPLGPLDVRPSSAVGRGPLEDWSHTYRANATHRSTQSGDHEGHSFRSGFSRAMGAVVSPLMDVLRPTRKDEAMYNVHVIGENVKTAVPNSYVVNPNDILKTTIKETTLYSAAGQINNQAQNNMYVANALAPNETQRDTASQEYFTAGGSNTGPMVYDAVYQHQANDLKSSVIQGRTAQGGTQIFNPQMNSSTLRDDTPDRYSGHVNPPFFRVATSTPSVSGLTLRAPQELNSNIMMERNTPDILNAFRSNPYTQPLTGCLQEVFTNS